jgi:glutamine synthetase
MTQEARIGAIAEGVTRGARSVDWPKLGHRSAYPSEVFGTNVFTLKKLEQTLPKPVYARFIQQIKVDCFAVLYALRYMWNAHCNMFNAL